MHFVLKVLFEFYFLVPQHNMLVPKDRSTSYVVGTGSTQGITHYCLLFYCHEIL